MGTRLPIEIVEPYSVLQDKAILDLVDKTIKDFLMQQPDHIRQYYDEIKNSVLLSLWTRQDSFDPSLSKSTTYFRRRISGAIYDWLRDHSPFSRSFHKKFPDIKMHALSGTTTDAENGNSILDGLGDLRYSTVKDSPAHSPADVDLLDFLKQKFGDNERLLKIINFRQLGYRNREISAMLGCSEATVGSSLQTIRKKLINCKNEYALPIKQRVRRKRAGSDISHVTVILGQAKQEGTDATRSKPKNRYSTDAVRTDQRN